MHYDIPPIGRDHSTLPFMALRRAERLFFGWIQVSYTLSVYTLIYIRAVLNGKPILRLEDYVSSRCITVVN
jgi:hypothetical protein